MANKKKETTPEVPLTENQVYDVLQFARNMNSWNTGYFSPQSVNSRLQDISLNPLEATEQKITEALLDPKNHERELIGYSEYFEITDMLYKRIIQFYGNILSFDYTYYSTNIKEEEDYDTLAYKKDEKILETFMDKFNYKYEFKKILRQIVRRETYYGVLRDDGDAIVIQELPQEYCKITGRFEFGLLYDFNYNFFIGQNGVDINCYPPIIRKHYRDIFKNMKNGGYKPSGNYNSRDGSYVYWKQTSPSDGFWCWKFDETLITNVPFFAPMFSDVVMKPTMRALQNDLYIAQASKLLIGLVGFNKDVKSGSVRDAIQLSPEVMGKFANLVKQGIGSAVKFAMAPFSDVKSFDFQADGKDSNILDQHQKTTVASSGSNTKLLYASGEKLNADESRNSLAIDEQLVTSIYPIFENFVNYYINKQTKKYKFKIIFEGTEMPQNRSDRYEKANTLAQLGIVLPQSFAAAIGKSPFVFEKQMMMAKKKNFVEGLTPIIMASQLSGKEDTGRPQKKTSELTDSGIETRDVGSNLNRGGEV